MTGPGQASAGRLHHTPSPVTYAGPLPRRSASSTPPTAASSPPDLTDPPAIARPGTRGVSCGVRGVRSWLAGVVGTDQAFGGGLAPGLDQELAELGGVDGGQLNADPAVAGDVGRDVECGRGGGDQGGLLLEGRLDGGRAAVIGEGGEHPVPDAEGRVAPGLALLGLGQRGHHVAELLGADHLVR
jgi:hypothetical protein